MDAYFVHALVLTDYEATLPAQSFEALLNEDYPTHLVYDSISGQELFHETPVEGNPLEKIALISKAFTICGIQLHWEHKVIIQSESQESR